MRKLVEEGKLIKLNKRYYENRDYQGEENDFYYLEAFASKGVVCLLSAARYYLLTTYIPDAIDVAIPRKNKVSSLPKLPKLKVHYFTEHRYCLGKTLIKEGRNSFYIYDKVRTVVDIVFYRNKVGIEETKEVLLNYLRSKDKNLNKLLEYAKKMKCDNILREYLEVLLYKANIFHLFLIEAI